MKLHASRRSGGRRRVSGFHGRIHAYLTAGPWANLGLSLGLRRARRWWRGPLEAPIHKLVRVCGPEPEMEFIEDATAFEEAVGRLQREIRDVNTVPPLIVEYRGGSLSVRDGSHRLEAMRRLGWPRCWVVIWYNSEADHERHGREIARDREIGAET